MQPTNSSTLIRWPVMASALLCGIITDTNSFSNSNVNVRSLRSAADLPAASGENKACGAKCVGYWKVYGDEKKAQKLFEQYRKCTGIYKKQWCAGKPLAKLAVAK